MTETATRRKFVKYAAQTAAGAALATALPGGIAATARIATGARPGDYWWLPERSLQGPVSIIVSLPEQLVHVYRNGIRIGVSTCSTGKPGHKTPTGVFTILQKDKDHRSSTYNNAPMPNMNRLTWSGIALHAGRLPGYPASHGCIRLPMKFSELLFGVTHVGTAVILADDHSESRDVSHPGAILSALAEDEMDIAIAKLALKKLPPPARRADMQHAVSLLVSGADRKLYIVQDGKIIRQGNVEIERPGEPLGSHIFTLLGAKGDTRSLQWKAVGFTRPGAHPELLPSGTSVIQRIESEPALSDEVHELMHPGLLLVMTDAPAHPDTRSDPGFVIAVQETEWTTRSRTTR